MAPGTGPRVLVVGSGPTGATYARLLIERTPDVHVLMVEAGPLVSTPPGTNAKNIDDPAEQDRARAASQGRGEHTAGVSALPRRHGRRGHDHRPLRHVPRRTRSARFRWAARRRGLGLRGSQGVHWTCATPRPVSSERIAFLPDLDELLDEASRLLHVTAGAFGGTPQAVGILERIGAEFAGDGLTARPLPVAADPRPDGTRPVGRHGRRPRPARRGRERRPFRAAPRDPGRADLSGTAAASSAPCSATSGPAPRRRSGPTPWWSRPTPSAPRSCSGTSGIRPEALGRYLTEHPLVFGIVAVREGVLPPPDRDSRLRTDPIRGVVSVAFGEGHPFHAQLMYSPICPVPLPDESPYRDNPAGYAMVGYGLRKFPRPQDGLTFDESTPDANGLPGVVVSYDLTDREFAEIEEAKKFQARAAGVLGDFVENQPRLMPPGTSLHFMGTFRMGERDDGTSVCDPDSRVWGRPRARARRQRAHPDRQRLQPDPDERRSRRARREDAGCRPRGEPMTRPFRPRVDVAIVGSGPTGPASKSAIVASGASSLTMRA